MIPRFKPKYDKSDWLAALYPTRGNIPKYERAFAEKFGCKYGAMFAHGRSGIFALLKVWGLENAEVICPAYTCVVVPNAIVMSGNIPVFVDSEKGHFNMSLRGIEEAITEKTRVIIPTHLFGYPMDVSEVEKIRNEAEQKYNHKIYVIQDCAHSYGAKWNGELVTKYGDAAVFGSNISKIINSIFGGMVITNNKDLANRLKTWRNNNTIDKGFRKSLKRLLYFIAVNVAFNKYIYGMVNYLENKGFLDTFVKYYDENVIDLPNDWNHAPSEIEARVGINQLRKYNEIIDNRIENAKNIINKMKDNNDIWMLPFVEGATYSHIVGLVEDRDAWINKYHKLKIQLGTLIEYSIPKMRSFEKYKHFGGKISYKYSKHTINFPV